MVSGRYVKVIQLFRGVEYGKFPPGDTVQVGWNVSREVTRKKFLSFSVAE